MRIGVNTLALAPGNFGEAIYLRTVMSKIREVQPDVEFAVFTDPGNHDFFEDCERIFFRKGVAAERDQLPISERAFGQAVGQANLDLVFSSVCAAPLRCPVPTVLYAMDLSFLADVMDRNRWRDKSRFKVHQRVCQNAAAIVATSSFIERQLLDLLDVPLNKVTVAQLGVSDIFAEPQVCWTEKPYLLAVGSTTPNKNHEALMEVFKHFLERVPHSLIIAGHAGELEPDHWGPRIMRVQRCPAAQLAALYQHCDAFIHPSLYEGSGVTVLEAMRAGAPVVTGRVGGIPEVAGNAPLYCNSESPASIIAAVRRALEFDDEERKRRAKYTAEHAAQFTWEQCAWKTLQALRKA